MANKPPACVGDLCTKRYWQNTAYVIPIIQKKYTCMRTCACTFTYIHHFGCHFSINSILLTLIIGKIKQIVHLSWKTQQRNMLLRDDTIKTLKIFNPVPGPGSLTSRDGCGIDGAFVRDLAPRTPYRGNPTRISRDSFYRPRRRGGTGSCPSRYRLWTGRPWWF